MRTLHAAALAALLAALLAACAARPPASSPAPAPGPVKDRDLGLSRASVFEAPAPPAFHEEASAPGERTPPPRLGSQIPPVVPHGVADLLPITREQNACVDCHAIAGPKRAGEPTPLPPSHYVDERNAPGKAGEKVAGARWGCMSCHVPRTDAAPLVRNGYRP